MTERKEDPPTIKDTLGWLKAYPHLDGPMEKVIWKAVFRDIRKYWLYLLAGTLAIELVWQAIFKSVVLLLLKLGFPGTAWFFD